MALKRGRPTVEVIHMSDLSNLLGNVYDTGNPDGPPVRREPSADERLEGPGEIRFDPPASELESEITSAISEAVVESQPAPAPQPVQPAPQPVAYEAPAPAPQQSWNAPAAVTAPVTGPTWRPGDDDIFPGVAASRKRR